MYECFIFAEDKKALQALVQQSVDTDIVEEFDRQRVFLGK